MDGEGLRLNMNGLDYLILALYFVTVLGVGFAARRAIRTSVDFFLSGRSLPAWVTGLAFVSANLGALEIIGMAANGAQYGVMTVHYYWIGAVPAMVFLGIVMMPFYYGSKVRSVPEYMRLRFNRPAHLLNARQLRRRPGADRRREPVRAGPRSCRRCSAGRCGPRSWSARRSCWRTSPSVACPAAIYNEVLQFFVIMAGLLPIAIIGLVKVGGMDGLLDAVRRHQARRGRPARVGRTPAAAPTRSARRGGASSSASASCCRSATGRRTSPRCSGPSRPAT